MQQRAFRENIFLNYQHGSLSLLKRREIIYMNCLYCAKACVKYGLYGRSNQRYKCVKCNRTFSDVTISNFNTEKSKRVVFHLLLAGCTKKDIAYHLEIDARTIKKWIIRHWKDQKGFVPDKPLLSINTLIGIYQGIEKSRITKFNYRRDKGGRTR